MTAIMDPVEAGQEPPVRRQRSARAALLRNVVAMAHTSGGLSGMICVCFVILAAVIGPFVTPYSPTKSLSVPLQGPSGAFLLGTDQLGRDVLSRVLAGGIVLVAMAVCATLGGVFVGAIAGIVAAYRQRWSDAVIMRAVDVILSFPQLVFALLLVSVVGPKVWLVTIAVGVTHAPGTARVIRSAALDITERDFVRAAELRGERPRRIIGSEMLPNLVSTLAVELGLRLTYSIIIIAGLAFLGFGRQPPAASWGLMIGKNLTGLEANPLTVIVPAALIALLTIGVNTMTDAFARVAIGSDRPVDVVAANA